MPRCAGMRYQEPGEADFGATNEEPDMKKTTIVVSLLGIGVLTAFATGCGPSKALQAAQDYEKAACACKDAACATDATKKFADASKDMATASSSEADAITKSTTNAAQCVTKVSMAGLPAMPGMPGK